MIMTDSEINLLPCPFCGGEAQIVVADEVSPDSYCVSCERCHCSSIVRTACGEPVDRMLAEVWNERQTPEKDAMNEKAWAMMAEWDDYKDEMKISALAYVSAIVTKDVYDELILFIDDDDEGEGSFEVYSITDTPKGKFKLVDEIDEYSFKYLQWIVDQAAVGCSGDSWAGNIYIRINSFQSLRITFHM